MKVVSLFGSPRANGNTASLTKTFNKIAEDLGAEVQTFLLNKLDIKGCQACDACKTKTDHCVIKDDLTKILESVKNADVLVAATPIYFADISAQFKIFIDRCYSYLEPYETRPTTSRLKTGKKFVLITAQNLGEDMFAEVCTKYSMIFELFGFKKTYLIRGCDLRETDALKMKNRQDLFNLAEETAKKVIKPAV
jgi:multimeric flavodoxin WrbA